LAQPKQSIMKRNLDGSVELFSKAIEQIRERGYEFGTMSDIVETQSEVRIELQYESIGQTSKQETNRREKPTETADD
jgi:hypothetical protein